MKKIFNILKRISTAFWNHILIHVLEGNFSKPWHFLRSNLNRFFFSHPYVAIIETGNYCNLRCPTCTTPANKICREKELMNFDNFKKVIDNIKDLIHVVLLYNSNEPLLNPDIFRMIKYAHENNLYTEISSNVTLFDKEKTKELFDSKLDKIILDLDGTSKESYEQFRVGANFEKVFKNIRYICQQKQILGLKKPFIELQFILNKLNQNEVEEIKKIAKELKVDKLSIKSFGLGEYAYSKEEIKALSAKFFPDTKKYQQRIRYKKEGNRLKIKDSPRKCSLVRTHFVVLVDGRISMCCYDLSGKYIYGNVLEQNLKDIWFSSKTQNMQKIAENRKYRLCKLCSIHD